MGLERNKFKSHFEQVTLTIALFERRAENIFSKPSRYFECDLSATQMKSTKAF